MKGFKLDKPRPVLREEFLEFLHSQQITQFSTTNLMEWYRFRMFNLNRVYNEKAAYPAVHRQVIRLLIIEHKIKRKSRGIYEVIKSKKETEQINTVSQNKDLSEIAEEKWSRLSGKGFNPDSLLDKDTIGRIQK